MTKKTKSALISVLSLTALTTVMTAASLNYTPVSAEADNVLTPIAFTIDDGASIRIGLEDDGNGSQKATAYEQNGIRFTARMEETVYEGLTEEQNIVFGILVLPYDYIADYGAVTTESVFGTGEKDVYTISESETDKIRVAYVETKELKEDSDGSYYYNVSMVNLKEQNKDREFVAVPYLKTMDELGQVIYDVKATGNPYSMAYTAQVEYAKTGTDALIKTALYDNYINGLMETVSVDVKIAYGGAEKIQSVDLTLALGEELTAAKVKAALEEENIDTSLYAFSSSALTVDGVAAEKATVYANGKTNAEVTLSYQASEAETDTYDSLKGYYTTTNFGSIILKSNNVANYNADLGMGDTETVGTYKFFEDGVFTLTLGAETYFGEYDKTTATCNVVVGDETHTYGAAVEAPASVYAKVRGYYETTDGKTVVVNSDGSLVADLQKTGSYVIAYNAEEENFQITTSLVGGNTCTTDFVMSEKKVMIGDVAYTLSTTKTLASAETYQAFAKTYAGQFYWPVIHTSNNNSIVSSQGTTSETLMPESSLEFSTNGRVAFDGYDFYSLTKTFDWTTQGGHLLAGKKYGSFVLFDNGAMNIYLPVMSYWMNNFAPSGNANLNATKDIVYSANYSAENGTVTLDTSNVKTYQSSFVYTAKATTGSVFANEEALYDAFSTEQSENGGLTGTATAFTAYREESKLFTDKTEFIWKFYNDKSVRIFDGDFTILAYYELKPITETFGEILFYDYQFGTAGYIDQAYYSYFGGFFRLSANLRLTNATSNHGGYNHFAAMYKCWSKGDNYYLPALANTFNALAGANGTVELPASKTYSSNAAELTLYNDGVLTVPTTQDGFNVSGGKATIDFKDGNDAKNITYDLVMKDSTSGKIFFNMDDAPGKYDAAHPELYADGDYYLLNGQYVIEFVYNGQTYLLAVGGSEELLSPKATLVGTYQGAEGTLTLNSDGTITGTDNTWNYVITNTKAGGLVVNDGIAGQYEILSHTVKLMVNGKVYIKTYTDDLYAKYAGTYTAEYETTYVPFGKTAGETIKVPMTLTLKADGTFSATGKTFSGANNTAPTDYYEIFTNVGYQKNQTLIIPKNHLGNQAKVGTYTFELVDGNLQIVLKFAENSKRDDLYSNGGTEWIEGYYAKLKYLQNAGVTTTTAGVPGASTGYVGVEQTVSFDIYNYAAGTAGDGVLNILFEAFSETPITLTKQQ